LKKDFSKESGHLQSQIKEIEVQNYDQQGEIKELRQQLEMMENNHEIELKRVTERKEYEEEKIKRLELEVTSLREKRERG
jgi:hypothetical protein